MYWTNSNFQTKAFIAGKCHTADEAYRILCQQLEDRERALREAGFAAKEAELAIEELEEDIANAEGIAKRKLELKLERVCSEDSSGVVEVAKIERDFIKSLITELEPLRKYKHLPDAEAHQAAQQEEWQLELCFRAENYLAASGTIPHDHLAAMRMHPEWSTKISPRLLEITEALSQKGLVAFEAHKSPLALGVTS